MAISSLFDPFFLVGMDGFFLTSHIDVDKAISSQIDLLHQYNDMKDVGQLLLGRLAELEGKTTKELYSHYGLDVND